MTELTAQARAELDHAVASSVEPLEAAVVLESKGVNDRLARDLFGAPDVVALARREISAAGPDRAAVEPAAAPAAPSALAAPPRTRWFAVRGLLYAVPALVALALVPSVDPVESALLLGGLVVSWAWCYGVASVAWAYLGDRDPAGARRFLRRSLLTGVVLAVVTAVVAVYAALILTATMQVTLATVGLLAGQSAYLTAAAVLLMTGRELWLLGALLPALVGLALELTGAAVPGAAVGPLGWIGAGVGLAVVFALVATRGAARPAQRLGAAAWARGLQQFGFGLLVALVVLFPAVNELVNENYAALPLSVTLAALPLVLSMGVAEGLVHRYRARMQDLLAATSSPTEFARSARRILFRHQLAFAATLLALSLLVGGAVAAAAGAVDPRYVLLALGYAVVGPALFAAMLLSLLGRVERVLETLGAAVVALAAFELGAATRAATDTVALVWFALVGAVVLVVHAAMVRRCVVVPVHHR